MTPAEVVISAVAGLLVTILLLQGPLRSYVPPCHTTSFGFCMQNSEGAGAKP